MDWAISLVITSDQSLESILKRALEFLTFKNPSYTYILEDLEATGFFGMQLSSSVEQAGDGLKLDKEHLVQLLEENGQIIEMRLIVASDLDSQFLVVIRDGFFLAIVGSGPKPSQQEIGPYQDRDKNLFLPLD